MVKDKNPDKKSQPKNKTQNTENKPEQETLPNHSKPEIINFKSEKDKKDNK